MKNLPEPIVQVTEYRLSLLPMDDDWEWLHWSITVEWREPDLWAVCHGSACSTKTGRWAYEPRPSARTDAWKRSHRFDLETALAIAKRELPKVKVNGLSATDVIARREQRQRSKEMKEMVAR